MMYGTSLILCIWNPMYRHLKGGIETPPVSIPNAVASGDSRGLKADFV